MALFQQRKRHKKVEAGFPPDHFQALEDLKVIHKARQVTRDPVRHSKVKKMAKEKLAEKRRRGKEQGMIEHEDNSMSEPKGGKHGEEKRKRHRKQPEVV